MNDRYDEICSVCGWRFGRHATGSAGITSVLQNQCPPHPVYGFDWSRCDPVTTFVGSGRFMGPADEDDLLWRLINLGPGQTPDRSEMPAAPVVEPATVERTNEVRNLPRTGWVGIPLSSSSLVSLLCSSGVCAARATISVPIALTIVSFPVEDVPKVEEALGISIGSHCYATDYGEVVLVCGDSLTGMAELTFSADTPEEPAPAAESVEAAPVVERKWHVYMNSTSGSIAEPSQLGTWLKPWASKLKRNIVLINYHGEYMQSVGVPDETLLIAVWPAGRDTNSARLTGTVTKYYAAYGIRLQGSQADGVTTEPFRDGAFIRDAEDFIVGIAYKDCLVIPYDLTHSMVNVHEIMDKLLQDYEKVRNEAELVPVMATRFNALVDAIMSSFETRVSNVTSEISSLNSSMAELQEKLFAYTRALDQMKSSSNLNLGTENILKLPLVHSVSSEMGGRSMGGRRSTNLVVLTKHIDFMHKGVKRLGHSYKISIDPIALGVYIKAIDDIPLVLDSYAHPHVNTDNVPCLGNIKDGVKKLLLNMEYATAVGLIIEYLGMAGEGDWYKNPTLWPLASEYRPSVDESATLERCSINMVYPGLTFYPNDAPATFTEDYGDEEDEPEPEDEDESWRCGNCGEIFSSYEDADVCGECGYCHACCSCEPEDSNEYEESNY